MKWRGLDIGLIEFKDRTQTLHILKQLVEFLISKEKTIILVRFATDVMEILCINNYAVLARPRVTVFSCSHSCDVESFIEQINAISSWHGTEFCLLIGSSEMPKEIIGVFVKLSSVFSNNPSLWFMDQIRSVNGIIQPVDSDFYIAGDIKLKELITLKREIWGISDEGSGG